MSSVLLGVDLGLQLGLALYGRDGRLRWYRSHHFASRAHLRRGAERIVRQEPTLSHLFVEGDRALAQIWRSAARRVNAEVHQVSPETWRRPLFSSRAEWRSREAKQRAGQLARRVIEWSAVRRPTSLRSHAAEAILIGLWGVRSVGWVRAWPVPLR